MTELAVWASDAIGALKNLQGDVRKYCALQEAEIVNLKLELAERKLQEYSVEEVSAAIHAQSVIGHIPWTKLAPLAQGNYTSRAKEWLGVKELLDTSRDGGR